MSLRRKLFQGWTYDEAECIRILFDHCKSLGQRGMAAEMLYRGQTPTAIAALIRFISDETQDSGLREEAAGTLGDIYSVIGVDETALKEIPDDIRERVLEKIPKRMSTKRVAATGGNIAIPKERRVLSVFSIVLGGLGLLSAYLCCRWTLFIRSVDLGNNDFAGLTYLILEGVLLLMSGGLALASVATGITGLFVERRKRMPGFGAITGAGAIGLIVYGFLKSLG